MYAFVRRLQGIARLVLHGELGAVVRRMRAALWSDGASIRLERDLSRPFVAPAATIPINIRPLRDTDLPALLGLRADGVSSEERVDRERRARLVGARLPTAYVAVAGDGAPCYVQWLIGAEHNQRIHQVWNGEFPMLAVGEALLEGAFTPEAFRGRRIMPAAMARIAEKASERGARRVVTFVTDDNIASLKGCARAGFMPVSARRISRRLFRTVVTPIPVPDGTWQHLTDVSTSPPHPTLDVPVLAEER